MSRERWHRSKRPPSCSDAPHSSGRSHLQVQTIFNNEVQNFVLNGPTHIFVVRDLMAVWGWGFTCPQPLPNPPLSRAKCNFQLSIQKKETEVSPRLTNFVLLYVLSINLAEKVANFRLTAEKDSEKSYRLDSGVLSINNEFRLPKECFLPANR